MKKVIDLYLELRDTSINNGNEIAKKFSIENHEDPASFFSMTFNNLTLTFELLDYYYNIWNSTAVNDTILTAEEVEETVK